jgi:hypothetical protein
MKKFFTLTTLMICLFGISFAQPTFNQSDWLAIGDMVSSADCDTAGVQHGPSGANQTWDFSTLVVGSMNPPSSIVSPASTPYASTYPSADMVYYQDDGYGGEVFSYINATSSMAEIVGQAIDTNNVSYYQISYPNAYTIALFPTTYNTTGNDTYMRNIPLVTTPFLMELRTYGSIDFIADGYGTLILPSGTYTNVLRTKTIHNATDSLVYTPPTIPASLSGTSQNITYDWYGPNMKSALLSIQYSSNTQNSTTTTDKNVMVGSVTTGIQDQVNLVFGNMVLYPNPAKGAFSIKTDKSTSGISVSLVDLQGRTVRSYGAMQNSFDISDVTPGFYLVKVSKSGAVMNIKLSVQ